MECYKDNTYGCVTDIKENNVGDGCILHQPTFKPGVR